MISIKGKSLLLVLFVMFSGLAVAQVPELSVSPSTIDESFAAPGSHNVVLDFRNQGSSRIYNVTLEDTEWLNWSVNRFDVNSSSMRNVTGVLSTERPRRINETFEVLYYWNESNSTGLSTNSSYYPDIVFQVETFYPETSVSANAFQTDFELQFDEVDSSVLSVDNQGNETAYNVTLNGSDVSFESSGFELPGGDDRLVRFNVSLPKPEENATAATNQSYTRTVTVSGPNFQEQSFNISVFVPYKQYDTEEQEEDLLEGVLSSRQEILEFCSNPKVQDSFLCGGQIVEYRNRTEYVYRTPKSNETLNESTILALEKLANQETTGENLTRQELRNMSRRLAQQLKKNQNTTEQMLEIYNQTRQAEVEEAEKRTELAQTRTMMIGVVTVVILLAALIGGAFFLFKKLSNRGNDEVWKLS